MSAKRPVLTRVGRGKERFHGLAEDFPAYGEAELLEAVPAKAVKIVHRLDKAPTCNDIRHFRAVSCEDIAKEE